MEGCGSLSLPTGEAAGPGGGVDIVETYPVERGAGDRERFGSGQTIAKAGEQRFGEALVNRPAKIETAERVSRVAPAG